MLTPYSLSCLKKYSLCCSLLQKLSICGIQQRGLSIWTPGYLYVATWLIVWSLMTTGSCAVTCLGSRTIFCIFVTLGWGKRAKTFWWVLNSYLEFQIYFETIFSPIVFTFCLRTSMMCTTAAYFSILCMDLFIFHGCGANCSSNSGTSRYPLQPIDNKWKQYLKKMLGKISTIAKLVYG